MDNSDSSSGLFAEGDLSSFLTAQGRKSTVDEKTIFCTPAPLAASTVQRNEPAKKRPAGGQLLIDSLLNATTDSPAPGLEDLPLVKFSFSDDKTPSVRTAHDQESGLLKTQSIESQFGKVPLLDSSSRSSMGILQLEGIGDLSNSMLLETSPDKNLSKAELLACSLPRNRLKSYVKENVTVGGYHSDEDDAPPKNLGTVRRQPFNHDTDTVKKKTNVGNPPSSKSAEGRQGEPPVMSMMFRNDADVDISVHEVKFAEDELMKFDEDFSDFEAEELDDTFTGLGKDSVPDKESGPVNFQRVSSAKQTTGAEVDIHDCVSSQSSFTAAVGGDKEEELLERHTGGHFEGEGQECDEAEGKGLSEMNRTDKLNGQSSLDQRYFRRSPMFGTAVGREQQRDRFLSSQVSLTFGDGDPDPGVRGQGAGTDNCESEIDTEDELEAARLVNATRKPPMERDYSVEGGDNEEGRLSRPGLEGAGSSGSVSSRGSDTQQDIGERELAEGVGETEGGGRRLNASDSVNLRRSLDTSQRQQTTLDVLRTMGFVGRNDFSRPPQFQEDDPEAQTRIRPIGDDLQELHSSVDDVHVRFASGVDYRTRSLSGASFDGEMSSSAVSIQGNDRDSRLDSQFLAPTNYDNGHMVTQEDDPQPPAWLDQSDFNLENAFPDSQCDATAERGEVNGELPVTDDTTATPVPMQSRGRDEMDRTLTPDNVFKESWGVGGLNVAGHQMSPFGGPSDPSLVISKGLNVEGLASEHGGGIFADFEGGELGFGGSLGVGEGGSNPFNLSEAGMFTDGEFPDEQFMSDGEGIALLEADEKEFKKEHQLIQEDQTQSRNATSDWSFHSVREISRPSWLADDLGQPGSDRVRVSIGTFMLTRTHALGSLEGEEGVERPTFGNKIITPPSNRKPVALIETSSMQLQSIMEDCQDVERDEKSKARKPTAKSNTEVSPEGAGLDLKDLVVSPDSTEPSAVVVVEQKDNVVHTPDTSGCSTPVELYSNASTPAGERTGFINNSAIYQCIQSASASQKPSELADIVLKMSNDRVAVKRIARQQRIEHANKKIAPSLTISEVREEPKPTKVTFAAQKSITLEHGPVLECPEEISRSRSHYVATSADTGLQLDRKDKHTKHIVQNSTRALEPAQKSGCLSPRQQIQSRIPVRKTRRSVGLPRNNESCKDNQSDLAKNNSLSRRGNSKEHSDAEKPQIEKLIQKPLLRSGDYVPSLVHTSKKDLKMMPNKSSLCGVIDNTQTLSGHRFYEHPKFDSKRPLLNKGNTSTQKDQRDQQQGSSDFYVGERECGEGKSFTSEPPVLKSSIVSSAMKSVLQKQPTDITGSQAEHVNLDPIVRRDESDRGIDKLDMISGKAEGNSRTESLSAGSGSSREISRRNLDLFSTQTGSNSEAPAKGDKLLPESVPKERIEYVSNDNGKVMSGDSESQINDSINAEFALGRKRDEQDSGGQISSRGADSEMIELRKQVLSLVQQGGDLCMSDEGRRSSKKGDKVSKSHVVRHIHRQPIVEEHPFGNQESHPVHNRNNNSKETHVKEHEELGDETISLKDETISLKDEPKGSIVLLSKEGEPQPSDFSRVYAFDCDGDRTVPDHSRLSTSFVLPAKHAERLARMQDEMDSDSSQDDGDVELKQDVGGTDGAAEGEQVLADDKGQGGVWQSPRPSSVTSRKNRIGAGDKEEQDGPSSKENVFTSKISADKENYTTRNQKESLPVASVSPGSLNHCSLPISHVGKTRSPESGVETSKSKLVGSGTFVFKSRSPDSKVLTNKSQFSDSRSLVNRSRSPESRSLFNRSKSPELRSINSKSRSPESRSYRRRSRSPDSRLSGSPASRNRVSRSPESRASKRSSVGIVSPSPHASDASRHVRRTVNGDYLPSSCTRGSLAFGDSVRSAEHVYDGDYAVDDYAYHASHQPYRLGPAPTLYVSDAGLHPPGRTHVVSSIVTPQVHSHAVRYSHNLDMGHPAGIVPAQPPMYMGDYRTHVYQSGSSTLPPGGLNTFLPTSLHPYAATAVFSDQIRPSIGVPPQPNTAMTVTAKANITAPPNLRFADVCCIGLSTQAVLTLKNPTNRWVQCVMKITWVRLDGVDQISRQSNPFTLKEKTIVEPGATEELKVVFLPKLPGVYVAQLDVTPSPVVSDLPLEPDRVPSLVTVQAVAEKPNIQVVTEGDRMLNFGDMPWGCSKDLPITLVNNGLAKVPVRMTISTSKSSWHCFMFDCQSSPNNTSVISNTKSLVNLILDGCSEGRQNAESSRSIRVLFRAPQRFDKSSLTMPPEEFSARIDIEVDSPSPDSSIGCVVLKCIVGSARLHVPRNMEHVLMKTSHGEPTTALVPIRNAGNIPLDVSLCVTDWDDQFMVLPSRVKVASNEETEVVVKFTPKVDGKLEYLSQLLLCIEPNGRAYEVQLQGVVTDGEMVESPPQGLTAPVPGAELLSNKHLLAWGGVAVGKALQQKLILCNNSNSLMKLLMKIKGNSVLDFQLQSFSEGSSRLSGSREVILKPLEEFPVYIIYSPSRVGISVAKLQVRPKAGNRKYSIPLIGYGGVSTIVVEHLRCDQQGRYWLSMGQLVKERNAVTKVTVRNKGSRPAYVKAMCFTDFSARNQLPLNKATVEPSEFCLQESETKTVAIAFHPSDRDLLMCNEKPFSVGAVAFFYGDEIARQRHISSVQTNGAQKCDKKVPPVASVNFSVPYLGEEHIPFEPTLPTTSHDQELFYSTMRTVKLGLVGESATAIEQHTYMQPLSMDDSVATVIDDTVAGDTTFLNSRLGPARPPGVERPSTPPAKGTPRKVSFLVKPTQLILTAARTGDPTVKYLQLTNLCERPLRYEMSWPANSIRITPEEGVLEPRTTTGVCVSARATVYRRGLDLPWSGLILIHCDGQQEEVKVQIRQDVAIDQSLYPSDGQHPLIDQTTTPSVGVTSVDSSFFTDTLKLNSRELTFAPTMVGKTSETLLHITNVSNQVINWTLSSFAPVYVKHGLSVEDVYRATYAAFNFTKKVGRLEPNEEQKIAIDFIPRETGVYSQHWELDVRTAGAVARNRKSTKIQLIGQGVKTGGYQSVDKEKPNHAGVSLTYTRSRRRSSDENKENKRVGKIVLDDHLCFQRTLIGEKSTCKIIVRNNGRLKEQLQSMAPDPPFYSKPRSLSIDPRHYLRLPVEFRPKTAGHHEGLLRVKATDGHVFTVVLHGEAMDDS